MKKFAIIMAGLLLGSSAFAQTVEDPNRLLLRDAGDNTKAYVLDRVKEVTFARVEGEVLAEIQVKEATTTGLTLAVTRTAACQSYKIAVLPKNTASQLTNDASMINYVNNYCDPGTYAEDFTNATLTGVTLKAGGDYTVVTIGIDEYNTEAGVCRADFSVPAAPVVGTPKVEAKLVKADLTSFTVAFTPNKDVSSYYCVAGEKGELEKQYVQFGPMVGATSMTDLVLAWGTERQGNQEIKWEEMAPNTEYEVYIVAKDIKGNPAPYQIFTCSTEKLGGDGEASVTITVGDYKMNDWGGEMKPSLFVTYTPNDQASCYRINCFPKDQYEKNREEIKKELCSDPEMPMVYWFFYEEMTTDYQIDPGQEVVIIAAAKNLKGEWGPVNEKYYTTPAKAAEGKPALNAAKLPAPRRLMNAPGRVPATPAAPRKLTLTAVR